MSRYIAATLLAASTAMLTAAPALSQDSSGQSSTRQVMGRVLDAILGPEAKEEPQPPAQVQEAENVPVVLSMQEVLADKRRDGDRARDQHRNPAQTLEFFKVERGMAVADYIPGSGYYTRVLAPFLGEGGSYVALYPNIELSPFVSFRNYLRPQPAKFESDQVGWKLVGAPVKIIAPGQVAETDMGTLDRVLIFREMHNLQRRGLMHHELGQIRGLLKADGMLGIVQHRAKADAPYSYSDGSKGYMREQDVIDLVEAHGFELVARSEINANPKDPANHPGGVWELPPSLSSQREELKSIGESDRMTLLFKKRP